MEDTTGTTSALLEDEQCQWATNLYFSPESTVRRELSCLRWIGSRTCTCELTTIREATIQTTATSDIGGSITSRTNDATTATCNDSIGVHSTILTQWWS